MPVESHRHTVWFHGSVEEAETARLCATCSSIYEQYGKLTLHIDSDGGFADPALATYWTLARLGNETETVVDGSVGSAAVLIYLGGQIRYISPSANIFVHHANQEISGEFEDEKKAIKELKAYNERMVKLMAKRCGRKPVAIRNLLAGQTVLTAKEAVRYGFAHEILA